jgi:hypothetical protein
MKATYGVVAAFVAALFFFGCEEDFNPKADFEDRYFLFAAFEMTRQAGASPQYVVVNKLYDVPGLNPKLNTTEPTVPDAIVTAKLNYSMFDFQTDTLSRRPDSRYDSSTFRYSVGDMPINPQDSITLVAVLPDGERLRAGVRAPHPVALEYSLDFSAGFTANVNRWVWGESWTIWWRNAAEYELAFPRMTIYYERSGDSTTSYGSVEVPTTYAVGEPVYPSYTFDREISYDFAAVDSAMANLSKGDPVKSRYRILRMTFSLRRFDAHLSKYYSSVRGGLDDQSVRVDATTYSNVEGGYGVVGVAENVDIDFSIKPDYILQFGYRY